MNVRVAGFLMMAMVPVGQGLAAREVAADIVVSGGSMGAPAAAMAAARANPDAAVLLIEPTDWLGGQATSQGVSAIDNAWHQPAQALMMNEPKKYYPADYLEFLDRMKRMDPEAPGEGMSPAGTSWVSRETYDPRTGAWVLDEMVAQHRNITVLKMTVVKDVETSAVVDELGSGNVISSLKLVRRIPRDGYVPFSKFLSEEFEDWYSTSDSEDFTKELISVVPADAERGLVVVDGSETADAVVLSGADYVVGRELTTETVSASGKFPEHDETASQATVFPFCMTDAKSPDDEADLKAPWPDFDESYAERKENYFGFGQWDFKRVWTYRRLRSNGQVNMFDSVFRDDVTMQNWYPGNDYPDKSMYLDKAKTAAQADDWRGGLDLSALAGAEKLAIQFYFYMKENNTEEWDTHFLRGDDVLNMMGTKHGLAKFPYVRCGRRIIGLQNFRLLQRYMLPSSTAPGNSTSFRFYDSVAIGNYAMDSHAVAGSSGVTHTVEHPAPFYLPYRALASSNVRNLLAGCKNFAGTYWTNSAYRLHPIEWSVGSAAGVAAALMARDGKTNADMLELPNLREMQAEIAKNSPISWAAYDDAAIPAKDGDVVVNDLRSIRYQEKVPVQIYSYESVRAEIYANDELVGETTKRVNDHLLFEDFMATTNPLTIQVRCYDAAGDVVTTLTRTLLVTNVPGDPHVIDDSDARFSIEGAWQVASAQTDRFADTYHHTNGVGDLKKAIWRVTVPAAGRYIVSAWWPAANNRATDVPYTIFHGGESTTVKVNQRENGGQWNALGVFEFTGAEDERVELTTDVTDPQEQQNIVVADAIRLIPVSASSLSGQQYN